MSQLIVRRGFLTGLAALVAAPAVIKASSLMSVSNIDHILYPIRGLLGYDIGTDRIMARFDRANFPIDMRPKGVLAILNEKQINQLITREQKISLLPTKPLHQRCLTLSSVDIAALGIIF